MYNLKHGRFVKNASIKRQASRNYLYGDDAVLENWFQEIETECSIILNKIIKTETLPATDDSDYAKLLFFILLSEARTLRDADSTNNYVDILSKIMLEMDPDKKLSKEDLQRFRIGLKIPNLSSIVASADSYPILFDLKASLLKIINDRSFITTDNPLARYNQMYVLRNYAIRGYGLGNMGIQLFFPISPKLCICIFDSGMYEYQSKNGYTLEIHKGKQVDEINKLLFLNSYETVFYNNNYRESDVRRVIERNLHFKNTKIDKEVTLFGPKENRLISFSQNKVTEKINLPFKIRKNLQKIPLPAHMAGPVRPYAKDFMDNRDQIK